MFFPGTEHDLYKLIDERVISFCNIWIVNRQCYVTDIEGKKVKEHAKRLSSADCSNYGMLTSMLPDYNIGHTFLHENINLQTRLTD